MICGEPFLCRPLPKALTIQVEWVKGHATESDIDKGRSTTVKAAHNETADVLATAGVEAAGSGIRELGFMPFAKRSSA